MKLIPTASERSSPLFYILSTGCPRVNLLVIFSGREKDAGITEALDSRRLGLLILSRCRDSEENDVALGGIPVGVISMGKNLIDPTIFIFFPLSLRNNNLMVIISLSKSTGR